MADILLAIFDQEHARPPTGLQRTLMDNRRRSSELERSESQRLSSERVRQLPKQIDVADGINWAFAPSTFTHYAEGDGVYALFAGEVSQWPGIDVVSSRHDAFVRGEPEDTGNDAQWLLKFYDTFKNYAHDETMPAALSALGYMRGRFAWVIYDAGQRRVLAARDRNSEQPLFWGLTPDQRFMIGSRLEDLSECEPTATQFPKGSMFTSTGTCRAVQTGDHGWVIPGDLSAGQVHCFLERSDHSRFRAMHAVPRINSKGQMCGAVYRVESEATLLDLSGEGPSPVF